MVNALIEGVPGKKLTKVTSDKMPDSIKITLYFSCKSQGEFDITSKVT